MAEITPPWASAFAWFAFALSWLAAAIWSRQTQKRAGIEREWPNRLVTIVGALLIYYFMGHRSLLGVEWDVSRTIGWLLFAGVLGGMAFAWWARLHLGTLWSGTVTLKQDHRIVDSGPYGIVRHPIYTGIAFSLLCTSLQAGRVEPIVGAALMLIGFRMKARLEETFLMQALGEAAYTSYRARVPMLIPFAGPRS